MPKPGTTKISSARKQTPATKSDDREPERGRVEVPAPEEQQEADGRHKGPDADARRVDFDVERRPANDQQQHGHARRTEPPHQDVGPARLDQRRVVLQPIALPELREALNDVVGQPKLLGLRARKF